MNNGFSYNIILQEQYKIIDIVNTSPASKLYKGYDIKHNCYVLLKEMMSDFIKEHTLKQQIMEQFKCEAKILFKLRHSDLPGFKDYFDYDSNKYLVLDYIECKRLSDIVETNSEFLSEMKVCDIAIQLCKILSYLHNSKPHPVIFRNLSPYSIFLTEDGKAKLLDFGISKIVNYETKNLAKTIIPNYSPLEQHIGTTDNRSDIYSLGATMYYLLTKEPPMDSLDRIIEDEPIPTCDQFNKDIYSTLVEIISKAMELDKKDRYQKIEEMEAELLKLYSIYENKHEKNTSIPSIISDNSQIRLYKIYKGDKQDIYNLSFSDMNTKILQDSPVRPERISKKYSASYPPILSPLTIFNKMPSYLTNETFDRYEKQNIKESITSFVQAEMSLLKNANIFIPKQINQTDKSIIKFTDTPENIKEKKEKQQSTILSSLFAWIKNIRLYLYRLYR